MNERTTGTICNTCSRLCDKIGEINSIGFTKSYCCHCFIKEFRPDRKYQFCERCYDTMVDEIAIGFQRMGLRMFSGDER